MSLKLSLVWRDGVCRPTLVDDERVPPRGEVLVALDERMRKRWAMTCALEDDPPERPKRGRDRVELIGVALFWLVVFSVGGFGLWSIGRALVGVFAP